MEDGTKKRVDLTALCDQAVVNPRGDSVGKVDQVMVNVSDGRIDYVILELNGRALPDAPRRIAIPWSQFRISTRCNVLQLDISRRVLDAVARTHPVR